MLIDSHCHINFPEFQGIFDDILDRMKLSEVGYALLVSTSKGTFKDIQEIVKGRDNLFSSVGVHPDDINSIDYELDELIDCCSYPKVIGIGETGLDYHWSKGDDLKWQHDRFITHIKASDITKLPLIIHTRDAFIDTLKFLIDYKVSNAVIHCFTGGIDFAKQVLDLGLYISFSGIVTFKNAKSIQEACKYVPDDRILVETDSPFLAPVPYRGKLNEPSYVKSTALFISQLRGQSFDYISKITSDNFFRLFSKARNFL